MNTIWRHARYLFPLPLTDIGKDLNLCVVWNLQPALGLLVASFLKRGQFTFITITQDKLSVGPATSELQLSLLLNHQISTR